MKLLSRMCDPQGGEIRIYGRDIREVTLASLRRPMGIVLQESFLFAGMIRENIRYGREFLLTTGQNRDQALSLLQAFLELLREFAGRFGILGRDGEVRLDTLGLVILDESQFLADPERGVVWEETIIFCPSQARLLLLSASIGNPQELAAWLTSIRPYPCHLVRHQHRSVPLRAGYLHPSGKLTPLFRTVSMPPSPSQAVLHPEAKRLFTQYEEDTLHTRRSG